MWGGKNICEISPGRLDVTSGDMQTCLAVRRLSCFSCWHASHVNPRALPALPELHCACYCVRTCVVLRYGLCTPPHPAPLSRTLPGQSKECLNGGNTQPPATHSPPPRICRDIYFQGVLAMQLLLLRRLRATEGLSMATEWDSTLLA